MLFIDQHSGAIKLICEKYKVKRLTAFGSVLTGHFKPDSDIDLIVNFEPLEVQLYADNYFNLKFALEDTFHRHIDLLEGKTLTNPYFLSAIENHRKIIYGH